MPERTRENTKFVIQSIDEYLGPSEHRFFGTGFKRSTYQIQPHMDDGRLLATVNVSYPTDWSLKRKGTDLRPHLSTVDAMVLGVRSSEMLLRSVVGLTGRQIDQAQIQKLVVRAGTRPEESLERLPLKAELKKTAAVENSKNDQFDTTITTQIGVMQATVVIRHEKPHAGDPELSEYSYIAGSTERYWGTGYRLREQAISNVAVDVELLSAKAEVAVRYEHDGEAGMKGSHSAGTATFIDAFVSLLQLGQVLLYELDGIDRGNSETLWMQRLTLRPSTYHESYGPAANNPNATLCIADHQLLALPTGKWRNVDFAGNFGGIDLSATFAHRIA